MQTEKKFDTLDDEVAERERMLTELKQSLADRERATDSLRLSLESSEQTLQKLRENVVAQEHALIAIRETNAQRARQMAEIDRLIAERETDSAFKLSLSLTLANAAQEALFVVDNEYRIMAINNAAEIIFNVQRPIGQPIAEVTKRPEIDSLLDDALTNDDEAFEEQMHFGKRVYRVRVQVIKRDEHRFIALSMADISDLVRLNRARRDMVANISHELRTPIANIRLIIESLFHEQEKPKRKQSTSALKAIARETDSLLWLVQELLDLSMIESGQAILRMMETSLTLMVDDSIERMLDQSDQKEITINSTVPSGIQVLADADQVRRVLLNLVHNAIKWSPPATTITITAQLEGDEVVVSVLDEGPGVPEDQTDRIFERFYQVDPSRSGGEGTGLGLAICKHIVEAHGGRIWAESNADGRGGHFSFTLPLA
jgi:two-component system, OmpR family, phosphate regulon sensor histidine kinase PhoR